MQKTFLSSSTYIISDKEMSNDFWRIKSVVASYQQCLMYVSTTGQCAAQAHKHH